MVIFYEKVNRLKIEDVLAQLEGDNIDVKMLNNRYNEFNKVYKEAVLNGLSPKYDEAHKQLQVDLAPVI